MKKLYRPTSKTFWKVAGGRMHTFHPIPSAPGSAPGHELQKPSKKYGIFQLLGIVNFVLFTKRQSQKGGGGGDMVQCPPPSNTLLYAHVQFSAQNLVERKKYLAVP